MLNKGRCDEVPTLCIPLCGTMFSTHAVSIYVNEDVIKELYLPLKDDFFKKQNISVF